MCACSANAAIPEAETCHHCGTPYLNRKTQVQQNGDATGATTAAAGEQFVVAKIGLANGMTHGMMIVMCTNRMCVIILAGWRL